MIAIVDYGIGNLQSVLKAVNRLGYNCIITSRKDDIERCDKLILPGVGNFKTGIDNLTNSGIGEVLTDLVTVRKRPILGICLGMQLMTESSEEGFCKGLGWINAKTLKFNLTSHKVPHIGWNTVEVLKCKELFENDEFYFVHSYYVKCSDPTDVLFRSTYEITFDSGFNKGNIFGVQFHPEKSHLCGLKLIESFLSLNNV